jgi:protein SCO1/2
MSRLPTALAVVLALIVGAACGQPPKPAPKRYPIKGQVLGIVAERQEITLKHDDIPNFMPAMTMNYAVGTPALLKDRKPGELISGTLEVADAIGTLVEITHVGDAPLPATNNSAALAEGLLVDGDAVPDVALIDQSDKRRSFSEWKGALTLVTFIYTSCPVANFCPLMDQNFSTIQRTVVEDPTLKGQVRLVSVSFDPKRDTPAVLAKHATLRRADPSIWTFLTGDEVTISRFVARFGVGIVASDEPGQIIHNLRTALIGKDGTIIKFYTGNDWTPGAVMADMRAALKAS